MKYFAIIALVGASARHHHHHHQTLSMLEGVNVPQPYGSSDKTFVPHKAEAQTVTDTQAATEAANVASIKAMHDAAEAKTKADQAAVRVERIQQTFGGVKYVNNLQTSGEEELNAMSDSALVSSLQTTLNQALTAEARDDKAAAVAKTAAIKNIQKALTARILKRLDDGQPLVEVARKMKAIEGMQPQINDMERRLGIMQSVEPVLENAIKTLQKVVDVRGMGKK